MIAPSGKTFMGWETGGARYQAGAYYRVNSNVTFTARWGAAVPVPSDSLATALMWISANAEEGGVYTITLNADETITPCHLFFSGKTVSITLTGGAAERTIDLSSNGSLFTLQSGVTLTLGSNVTLRGRTNNTDSLVRVDSGATLVMEDGSKISGNTSSSSYGGGGVYVASNGTFTMSGGEIAGNTANSGGGVYVDSGRFTKSGGTIYGSNASDTLKNTATSGNAVYASSAKKRNATAGPDVNMDSTKDGAAGGWLEISISSFSFANPPAIGVINGTNISITVPYDTNLNMLVPEIIHTGVSVSPASGTAQNFSSPVTYTVTAEYGSTADYIVTVTVEEPGAGEITLIYPLDEASGELSGGNITISKPSGTETLAVSGTFDTYRWRVDGAIRGSGNTFTLNAGDYTTGIHQLSLEVSLGGVVYSKAGAFTVQ
jgi:hypothetical protein